MPPLDPRWLEALDDDRPPTPEVETRVRARLEDAIPEMRRRSGGGGGGSSIGGALLRSSTHLAAFVAGGVAGAALWSSLQRPAAPRLVFVDRPVTEHPEVTAEHPEATAAPVTAGLEPTSEPAAAAALGSRPAPASTSASQLAAERRLLDAARLSFAQGDGAGAERKLETHRARFPRGLLAEEREAMLVQTLVKEGRYDEARARASAFEQRSAHSLFASAVQAAIDSIPVTATPVRPNSGNEGVTP
jgi:hypothetical protein